MRKLEKFVISKSPYAINLESFKIDATGMRTVEAVWFRRKDKKVAACLGQLREYFHKDKPTTVLDFIEQFTDGRYGGSCWARFDGGFWTPEEDPNKAKSYLEFLKPMLDNYPAIPKGFDGWWTFK